MSKSWTENLPYRGRGGRLAPNVEPKLPFEVQFTDLPAKDKELLRAQLLQQLQLDPERALLQMKWRYKDADFRFSPEFAEAIKDGISELRSQIKSREITFGSASEAETARKQAIGSLPERSSISDSIKQLGKLAATIGAESVGNLASLGQSADERAKTRKAITDSAKKLPLVGPLLAYEPMGKNILSPLVPVLEAPRTLTRLASDVVSETAGDVAALFKTGKERTDRKASVRDAISRVLTGTDNELTPETRHLLSPLGKIGDVLQKTYEPVGQIATAFNSYPSPAERDKRSKEVGEAVVSGALLAPFVGSSLKSLTKMGARLVSPAIAKINPKTGNVIARIGKVEPPKYEKIDPAVEGYYDKAVTGTAAATTPEELVRSFSTLEAPLMEPPAKAKRSFFSPLEPLGDRYRAARLASRGFMERGEKLSADWLRKMKEEIPPDRRKLIGEAIDAGDTELLSPAELKYHNEITGLNDAIGEGLVRYGTLTPEQLAGSSGPGKYMHRVYEAEAGEQPGLLERLTSAERPGLPLDTSIARRRADLPPAERKALGQITDVAQTQEEYLRKSIKDLAQGHLMEQITQKMPGLVRADVALPVMGDMSIQASELPKALKGARAVAKRNPENIEAQARLTKLEELYAENKDLIPKHFVKLDDVPGFGPLRGQFVHPALANDFKAFVPGGTLSNNVVSRALSRGWADAFGLYKKSHTILNVPTLLRNYLGDTVARLDISGIPIDMAARYWARAAKEIANGSKSELYKEVQATGVLKGSFVTEEMGHVINTVAREMQKSKGGLNAIWGKGLDAWDKYVSMSGDAYNMADKITYFAKYMWERDHGASRMRAAKEASKWGLDYSEVPETVKALRRNVAPFATYQFKMTPLIAEALAKRPGRLLKYYVLPHVIGETLADKNQTFDPQERDAIARIYTHRVIDGGHPFYLPFRSPKGEISLTDLSRFVPWGGHEDAANQILRGSASGDLGAIASGVSSGMGIMLPFDGLFDAFSSITKGEPIYDTLTNKPLLNPLDSAWMKILKLGGQIGGMFVPPYLTRAGKKISEIQGGKDKDVSYHDIMLGLAGVTTTTLSPAKQQHALSEAVRSLEGILRAFEHDHSPDEPEYADKRGKLLREIYVLQHAGALEADRLGIDPQTAAIIQHDKPTLEDMEKAGGPSVLDRFAIEVEPGHRDQSFWLKTDRKAGRSEASAPQQ